MEFKYLEDECVEEKERRISKKVKGAIVLGALAVIIIAIVVVNVHTKKLLRKQTKGTDTIKLVCEDLYSMEYSGDYKFDEFLAQGGVKSDEEMIRFIEKNLYYDQYDVKIANEGFGCSTLSVKDENGAVLFGRNYDSVPCKAMTVITRPEEGYDSISTCALNFIGIGDDWNPENSSDKMKALVALYIPVDGMNEKGVCIAVLQISDGSVTEQNTEKADITTTTAVRLVLDKAANVDEAIALLKEYDMHSSVGHQFKFAISDATGKTVLVEYIKNEMNVVDAVAASNFYQTPGEYYGRGLVGDCPRYGRLMAYYNQTNGVMSENVLMEAMEYASQKYFYNGITQWTAVYNTKELTATYCSGQNYDEKIYFKLKE